MAQEEEFDFSELLDVEKGQELTLVKDGVVIEIKKDVEPEQVPENTEETVARW
jgi:hypothetical protein